MELILMLSGTSILVTLFMVLMFFGGIPALMIFKKAGNEKIAASVGVVFAIIICQSTFNAYFNIMSDMKLLGILTMIVFFIVLSIPFVTYAFPDFTFPGRAFLLGGFVSCILAYLDINFLDLDLSSFFTNQIVLYISCAWSVWHLVALINNPTRRKKVFNNIFKGETQQYVEGDFR